jgi:spermidine/putrescine transport system permease protein
MKKKFDFKKLYLVLIMIFFYAPIVYVILFSFNSSKSLTNFTGFSLKWYQKMFKSRSMMESIYYSLLVACIATGVSTIVGTIASIGLSKSNRVIKEVVTQINNLPMLNPDIVTAIGMMLFFATLQVPTGFFTLLIAHIVFCIPYVMLSINPRLRQLDDNVFEAALDLGCTPYQALTKVIIPQIKEGIVSGALVAFTMSFDDFVISYFTTGPGISNISTYVYTASKRINPSINALSSLIVLGISAILIVINLVPVLKQRRLIGHEKVD